MTRSYLFVLFNCRVVNYRLFTPSRWGVIETFLTHASGISRSLSLSHTEHDKRNHSRSPPRNILHSGRDFSLDLIKLRREGNAHWLRAKSD
jgi:hypothetical protein